MMPDELRLRPHDRELLKHLGDFKPKSLGTLVMETRLDGVALAKILYRLRANKLAKQLDCSGWVRKIDP